MLIVDVVFDQAWLNVAAILSLCTAGGLATVVGVFPARKIPLAGDGSAASAAPLLEGQ